MRLKYLLPLLVLGAIGTLALTGCGGSGGDVAQEADAKTSAEAAASAADAVAAEAAGYIASSKAGGHMGEEGTVQGSVKAYNYINGAKGRPYILIFDKPAIIEKESTIWRIGGPIILQGGYLERLPQEFPSQFCRRILVTHGVRHGDDR